MFVVHTVPWREKFLNQSFISSLFFCLQNALLNDHNQSGNKRGNKHQEDKTGHQLNPGEGGREGGREGGGDSLKNEEELGTFLSSLLPPLSSPLHEASAPNHQRWHAKWKLSRNTHTLRTRFVARLRTDLHAQSVIVNKKFCIGAQSEVY